MPPTDPLIRPWSACRLLTAAAVPVLLLAGVVLPGQAGAAASADAGDGCPEFFVSPTGRDTATGTKERPWRTIERARDVIRSERLNDPATMNCDIVVSLRAGTYPVDKTITFSELDSGANGHQVVYRSYDGPGKAHLVGARPVTGWQPYRGGIQRAHVGTSQSFHTLFENGVRARAARYPNRRSEHTWAPYLRTTGIDGSYTQLRYAPGDVDPAWDLDDAQVVIWSGGDWSWFTDTVPIASLSAEARTIALSQQTRYPTYQHDTGSRYFVQNSLSLLDEPGEFYLDRAQGYLYYWPYDSAIGELSVMAPTVKTIVEIAGSTPSSRVHDLVLDGLALQYTDFTDWYRYGWVRAGDSGENHAYPVYDRQIELPQNRLGAITLTNTRGIRLQRLHISDTGYSAVFMLFANDHDVVTGNLIENVGSDGIKVEGPYPGEGDVANNNAFTNNHIRHVGELVAGDAAGIELMNTGSNEIAFSTIEYSPRYAVSLETRPEAANADNYAHDNVFSYLRMMHVGQDSGDTGAFYEYGVSNAEPWQRNTLRQAIIDDVHAYPSLVDTPPSGVHMDYGTCGQSFENVQVTNVQFEEFRSGDQPCYLFKNVSWRPSFDPARIEHDLIGVRDDFPYVRSANSSTR